MSAANLLPEAMTVDQFLAWKSPDGSSRWQLIDGVPCLMTPSSPRHSVVQSEAARIIGNHLVAERPECHIGTETGLRPRVRSAVNVRIPDLAVTCSPVGDNDRLFPDPVLIIEILSRSNRDETWANVWSYVTIPTVREIAITYLSEMRIDLLRRYDDHTWPDDPLNLTADDMITLDSIGFTVPVAAFYRTVLL